MVMCNRWNKLTLNAISSPLHRWKTCTLPQLGAPSGGGVFRGDLQRFYDGKQDENPSEMAWLRPSTLTDERSVKLLAKDFIADNTILLTFEKPKDLAYQAGQYAVLCLDNPRYTALDIPLRPLSMVSHPKDDTLQFAMRLSDSSFKKSVAAMAIGDTATIFAPMGNFTLKAKINASCSSPQALALPPYSRCSKP